MNTTSHHSPLWPHFKTIRFWLDLGVLGVIWWAALQVGGDVPRLSWLSVALVFKLLGLVGLLEAASFFVSHLFGVKRGLLVQGLIGGFISSTAVFVRLTSKPMREAISSRRLARALLLAVLSMLLECLMILYALTPEQFFSHGWPIGLSMVVIILTVWLLPENSQETTKISMLEKSFDRPVAWLRVFYFTAVIVGLMWLIRFLNDAAHLPILWSTFLLSIFEAHAVLAASLLNLTANQVDTNLQGLWLVIMVLLGNTVSKFFLVLKTGSWALCLYVLSPLIGSVLLSVLIVLLMPS